MVKEVVYLHKATQYKKAFLGFVLNINRKLLFILKGWLLNSSATKPPRKKSSPTTICLDDKSRTANN